MKVFFPFNHHQIPTTRYFSVSFPHNLFHAVCIDIPTVPVAEPIVISPPEPGQCRVQSHNYCKFISCRSLVTGWGGAPPLWLVWFWPEHFLSRSTFLPIGHASTQCLCEVHMRYSQDAISSPLLQMYKFLALFPGHEKHSFFAAWE